MSDRRMAEMWERGGTVRMLCHIWVRAGIVHRVGHVWKTILRCGRWCRGWRRMLVRREIGADSSNMIP